MCLRNFSLKSINFANRNSTWSLYSHWTMEFLAIACLLEVGIAAALCTLRLVLDGVWNLTSPFLKGANYPEVAWIRQHLLLHEPRRKRRCGLKMQISKNDICKQKNSSFNQINFCIILSAGNKGVPTCSKAARASGFDTQEVTFYMCVSCTNYIIPCLCWNIKL